MTSRHESAPAWAYEPVRVVEPDPRWPALAQRYAREVDALLGDRLAGPVLHVGSTAIPGLPAKPIIDLQAVATEPAQVIVEAREALSSAHWHVVPRELDQRPWRWFVVRSDDCAKHRLAHLHLMTVGEPRWHEQIAFRDRLRASEELAREYARLKASAAARHGDDREAYARAKFDFVHRVLGPRHG
ncbi:GrpB family protein [Pseudonocardia nantongensis]|uniref:GrpB family protein n=1 Tax=Pseudonocardia nantongensis TaxID=1181885 RepID=UPI00397B4E9E